MVLTAAAGLLAVATIPGIFSEPVLPDPPSTAEHRVPARWVSLPAGDAEHEFTRTRRAAQLNRAQEQLAALREHADANDAALHRTPPPTNVLVLRSAPKSIPPADLLVPHDSVVTISERCPDEWEPYVNADGEPLYFPFALLDEESPGASIYHSSLLAACRKP